MRSRSVIVIILWILSLTNPLPEARAATLAESYPRAEAAFALIEKSPLLRDIILDEQFFDKLDTDADFVRNLKEKLTRQAYRNFGPVPSVRVSVRRGTPMEYPFIILEYQTSFKNLMHFGGGRFHGHCVFVGGGRDAIANRTFYGGSEDPNGRKAFDALEQRRLSLPSNRRNADTEEEFQKLFAKYLPSMPIGQVHDAVRRDIETLVRAFDFYGSRPMRNPTKGSFGVKLMDKVYIHIRTFGTAEGFSGEPLSEDVSPNPYFWLIIGGGQRPRPSGFLPAFPGAEGMGSMATGGRGGKVIYVTNLNPTGPGSLAEALNTKGPRTVLFNVSGQIKLPDPTWIREPDMTLIGYTAPGEGVEIWGRLSLAANNIIMRGMRWRLRPPLAGDGMNVEGEPRNIIFDHCSFAYGSDELLRFIGDGRTMINYTIQRSILGPAMGGIGSHPFGPAVGGIGSIHHNLLYHTLSRSPEVDCDLIDFRNNIIFNCRSGHSRRLHNKFNMVNNLIILHPGVSYRYSFNASPNNYISGNLREAGNITVFNAGGHSYLTNPYPVMPVTTYDTRELESSIIPGIGASMPVYDSTDRHWLRNFMNRRGKMPFWKNPDASWRSYDRDSNDMANYEEWTPEMFPPPAAGATPTVDSDSDGMPDDWETEHKLNPNEPSDGPKDTDKDGYTNLEEWLYSTNPHEFIDYRIPANNVDRVF